MKNTLKKLLIILLIALIIGAAIGGYFIYRHNSSYISSQAALDIALSHAGLQRPGLHDVDVEFEKHRGSAWYEVDFETPGLEYAYSIDAVTGEILYSHSKPDY